MIRTDIREAGGVEVAVVTIERPERRNALDIESCRMLFAAIEVVVTTGCRALVLHGAGPSFCAGADLDDVAGEDFAPSLRSVLEALSTAPLACIAAVGGPALGAGVQLALACDLRMVGPAARFGVPAARLGLMVDNWTARRLSLLAGHSTAQAMLLAAHDLDAERALATGFAQRAGGLDDAVGWAEDIAALAPLTVRGHKLALNQLTPFAADPPELAEAHRRAWSSSDLAEGMAAFRERRPPRFRGR